MDPATPCSCWMAELVAEFELALMPVARCDLELGIIRRLYCFLFTFLLPLLWSGRVLEDAAEVACCYFSELNRDRLCYDELSFAMLLF